jgi:alkanesulfonate monooxygenase SsuD/methylene tetrahydromethanopterin reductase-like flavin-dependent oxidoreductase (luciferase family)
LGSQVGPTLSSRFGVEADRPAARLRDYVLAVRSCWDAYRRGRGRYEGRFYTIRQPVFAPGADPDWPAIPLYLAGVNPVMTAVAGEVGDGFAAHMFCTPTYLAHVLRPALARGATRAGRTAPPVLMPIVVGHDRTTLAMQMTTYTVPAYRRVLDESGLREEADAILVALAERRRTEAARIIAERCLDELGVTLLEDLTSALDRWRGHAEYVGLAVPWFGLEHGAQVALYREVLRALERMA